MKASCGIILSNSFRSTSLTTYNLKHMICKYLTGKCQKKKNTNPFTLTGIFLSFMETII